MAVTLPPSHALSLCLALCILRWHFISLTLSRHLHHALPVYLSDSVSPFASCAGTLCLMLCAAAQRAVQIKKRGSPPEGGGEVVFKCPTVKVPSTQLVAGCTAVTLPSAHTPNPPYWLLAA